MSEEKTLDNKVVWLSVEAEQIPRGWVFVSDAYRHPKTGSIIVARGSGRTLAVARLNQQQHYNEQVR